MNAVMVRGSGQGMVAPPRKDPYAIEVDRGKNCYVCRRFGHMAHYCRNQKRGRIADRRRLEYREERIEENHVYENNLKGKENLKSLN